jgi:hypothetical protein
MQHPAGPTIITTSDSKAINVIAVTLAITVSVITIYYLLHQTKLVKLQLAEHKNSPNGHPLKKPQTTT